MPQLNVVNRDGSRVELKVPHGLSLMEVLRDAGLLLAGDCNGSLACATCHVIVDPAWASRLPAATGAEEDLMDVIFGLSLSSRLSCQIRIDDCLDGLMVRLP